MSNDDLDKKARKAASNKRYRIANAEKLRASKKAYRLANLDAERIRHKNWRHANPEKMRAKARERHNADPNKERARLKADFQKKQAVINELKSKPCMDCKIQFLPCAMQFDHRRGIKRFRISAAALGKYTQRQFQEELDKCDLVCANCHAVRTWKNKDTVLKRRDKQASCIVEDTAQLSLFPSN